MPIEIKELHIKINVDEKTIATTTATSLDEAKIMQSVSESVEQIVNIEKRKKKDNGRRNKKIRIGTYEDSTYGRMISSSAFVALINPTGFSFTRKNEYNTTQEPGTSEADPKYVKASPQSLQLEFLFDGTGVTKVNSGNKLINKIKEGLGKRNPFSKKAVEDQLAEFYVATGNYNGSIHKPYNVIIIWENLNLKECLPSLQSITNYLIMMEHPLGQ